MEPWCAYARRWRPMRSPLIEAASACQLSLDAAGRSGAENMAIDAALLDRANGTGLSFLRLYRFDPPCLSLGRNERSEEHTSELQSRLHLVCRLLLEKKKEYQQAIDFLIGYLTYEYLMT